MDSILFPGALTKKWNANRLVLIWNHVGEFISYEDNRGYNYASLFLHVTKLEGLARRVGASIFKVNEDLPAWLEKSAFEILSSRFETW